MKFSPFIIRNKYLLILILVGVCFVFINSWLYHGSLGKFSSPDETANYYFTKLFAETNELRFEQAHTDITHLVKPRSMSLINGYTVPSSFIGIILLYGLLAKLFSTGIILYLTPIFSSIAVVFFYLLIKHFFSNNIAFLSSMIMFFMPPFLYYSSRGMFHNVLFLSLLIIGLYFLVRGFYNSKNIHSFILFLTSGLFIGLSIITRTSESIWIFLVLLFSFIVMRKKVNIKKIMVFLLPILIILGTLLIINNSLFGNPLNFSKSNTIVVNSEDSSVFVSDENNYFKELLGYLSPYGYDKNLVEFSVLNYLLLIFPWFSLFIIISFIWFLKLYIFEKSSSFFPSLKDLFSKIDRPKLVYVLLFLFVSVWLILYYGSYSLNEFSDNSRIILGSSYLRYWLPIYVFGLPLVIYGIYLLSGFFRNKKVSHLLLLLIFLIVIFSSTKVVFNDELHGLFQTRSNNIQDSILTEIVYKSIKNNSIIISGDADKVFFPNNLVIFNIPGDKRGKVSIVNKLLNETDVYYFFNPLDSDSVDTKQDLEQMNVFFEEVTWFQNDVKTLYKLR